MASPNNAKDETAKYINLGIKNINQLAEQDFNRYHSSQCSSTGVTKAVACTIQSVR